VGRPRRWAVVLTGLAALIALPVVISHRPLNAKTTSAAQLLSAVRHSGGLAYSGLVQTHGDLSLPNLPDSGGIAALLSSTTRLRVWRDSATSMRVDQLSDDGETDTIIDGSQTVTWDSTHEQVSISSRLEPLRVPQTTDLLPPALAQRLTPTALAVRIERLPASRVAGRTALGLRLTPTAATTTIRYVDIDVDENTGLPLRVAVTGLGQSSPSFSANFLQVQIGTPPPSTVSFQVPSGAIVRRFVPADFVADANRYAPFQLPKSLAGLPRTQRVSTLTDQGGAGTYGDGYTLLVLLPMQQSTARQVIHALAPPIGINVTVDQPGAQAVEEHIPLANVLAVDGGGRAYLLAGTVTPQLLLEAANQMLANPPPFRPRGGPP
jgi:outer membrane lipoprotein-sorting protein